MLQWTFSSFLVFIHDTEIGGVQSMVQTDAQVTLGTWVILAWSLRMNISEGFQIDISCTLNQLNLLEVSS